MSSDNKNEEVVSIESGCGVDYTNNYYTNNIDDLIEQQAVFNNLDYNFKISNENAIIYYTHGKELYLKCPLTDYEKIEWFISGKNAYESCEEAMSRIKDMQNKLKELENVVFSMMLEQKNESNDIM